ncbi:MAG: hypothetical protein IJN70_01275 [Clostridia bacterium]|nr:hypothetical protein [Clostridia bacterium]
MYDLFIKVLSFFSAFLMLFLSPGGHIGTSVHDSKCPEFFGEPAEVNELAPIEVPQHPYLATEGTNGMHGNSYNTGSYNYMGPLGINPVVTSRSMNVFGGLVATLMFDSQGRIMCISGNVVGFRLLLLDAETLEILCETRLPQRPSTIEAIKTFNFAAISSDTSGGAYCHLLAGDRPIIGNSDNVIQIYYVDESSGTPEWKIEKEWNISDKLPEGSYITDAIPDFEGNIWFVTRPGEVGYVDPETGDVHMMTLTGEEIQNTLAICEDGIYIVSDHAMYRFEIDADGTPVYTWKTVYDRGTTLKPGAINQGSGTTPTLLDVPCADGSVRKLVAITDNADEQVHVCIYDRLTGEVIAEVPVFTKGKSVSENSLIAHGRSFIVENNYSESGSGFLVNDPTSEPGVVRIDMNADCTDAFIAWESNEASCTVVPKLSTKNGLVYLYTREYGNGIPEDAVAWYLTAVDFETGETVYKVFTGCGKNWNNSYGPITIGPNGKAYVGVFNGVISVADSVE